MSQVTDDQFFFRLDDGAVVAEIIHDEVTLHPDELGMAGKRSLRRGEAVRFPRFESLREGKMIGGDVVEIQVPFIGRRLGTVAQQISENEGMAVREQSRSVPNPRR